MGSIIEKEIFEEVSRLPDEKSVEYASCVAKLSEKCADKDYFSSLKEIQKGTDKTSFNAFFIICTYYRRNKDFELFYNNIENNKQLEKHYFFEFVKLQYLVNSEAIFDYEEVLTKAYKYVVESSYNSAICQLLCNAYATICENSDIESRKAVIEKWGDIAVRCIDASIKQNEHYAKFYCTKGRILCLAKRFDEAISLINIAISKEESNRRDYSLAISQYQFYKMNFILEQRLNDCNTLIADLNKRLNEALNISDNTTVSTEFYDVIKKYSDLNVYEGKEKYSFISYAHRDAEIVLNIIDKMAKENINIWFDKGIKPTKEWPEVLGKHISDCDTFVIMLSSNSLKSLNVRAELALALNKNKKIVVIKLDNAELSPGMSLQLGLQQMIVKSEFVGEDFEKEIIRTIKEIDNVE